MGEVRRVGPGAVEHPREPASIEKTNRLVRDPSIAVTVSDAHSEAPTAPFRRPKLPPVDAPRRSTTSAQIDPGAARLAKIMGDEVTALPPEISLTTDNPVAPLLLIMGQNEDFQRFLLKNATESRKFQMDKLNQLEKKQTDVTLKTEKKMTEIDSSNFYSDLISCFAHSASIVCGGIVFNTPGFQMMGAGMIASGSVGIGSQVLKSLGYNATVTGAVSIISAAIGMMTGTASYAIVQPNRAQAIMRMASVGKAFLSLIIESQKGYAQNEMGQLRGKGEVTRGKVEQATKKLESGAKRAKKVAELGDVANKAMRDYLEQLDEVKKRAARAASAA